jgi:LysR family transcriptional regulator, glycine cleavage system transcriptional activator
VADHFKLDLKWIMPPALPPLDSLRVLAACVRHSNFSKAAQELGLTPAAVSLRMRALEAQLGVKLFLRNGPRLTVSDQGVVLGEKIEHAISLMQSAVDVCRKAKRPLRVTCAPTFASRWLVPRLADYHASPGAQPITLDATETLLPATKFDVAIRSGVGPWPGFSSAHLLPDEGTPMLSPSLISRGKRLSLRGLLKLPLITDGRWSKWFELAGLRNARPRFAATRFPNYELEALAAVQGVGVALLSPFLFEELRARGALIAPFDTVVEGPNSYWALWPARTPTPHFVNWLQGKLQERRVPKM